MVTQPGIKQPSIKQLNDTLFEYLSTPGMEKFATDAVNDFVGMRSLPPARRVGSNVASPTFEEGPSKR